MDMFKEESFSNTKRYFMCKVESSYGVIMSSISVPYMQKPNDVFIQETLLYIHNYIKNNSTFPSLQNTAQRLVDNIINYGYTLNKNYELDQDVLVVSLFLIYKSLSDLVNNIASKTQVELSSKFDLVDEEENKNYKINIRLYTSLQKTFIQLLEKNIHLLGNDQYLQTSVSSRLTNLNYYNGVTISPIDNLTGRLCC